MDAAAKTGIKVIYGVEAYLVDDLQEAVIRGRGQGFSEEYVVLILRPPDLIRRRTGSLRSERSKYARALSLIDLAGLSIRRFPFPRRSRS
ncbi:MAG: hypothetical protein ACLR23_12680 [Clostridia bacterium]